MSLPVFGNGLPFVMTVMNHVDGVIKRDVHPQKMYSCSKNIRGIIFCSKYIRKNIMGDIAWIFAQLKDKRRYTRFIGVLTHFIYM